MTTTPTIWSGPIVFDQNQLFTDTAPKLLTLADDSFILGWENGTDLFARHLNPFGSFTAGNFLSGVNGTTDQLHGPQFVQAPNGTVVAVYNQEVSGDTDTFWRQVDPAFGSVTGGGTIVGPTANDEIIEAASASVSGSAIVYTQSNISSTLLMVFVGSNGLPTTNAVVIGGHPAATIQIQPGMQGLANGDVAVAFTNFSVANGAEIHLNILRRDPGTGNVSFVGGEIVVSAANIVGTSFADVATINNGTLDNQSDDNLVVVWQDNSGINFRRYTTAGGALDGNAIHAAGSSAGDLGADVTGLNDGGFIISWRHDFGTTGDGIVLQRFDKNGVAIGSQVQINDAGDEGSFGTELGTLDDGRVIVAYTNGPANPGSAPTTLDYVIVDPRETTINGSATADTIIGRKEASTINGLGGSDHLFGMNKNDKLLGGDGDDILTGGKGRDQLTGGLNDDTFDFNSVNESKRGAPDVIKDFSPGSDIDLIDLEGIDAKTGGANNKFKFIGTQAFHERAGELHYTKINKPGTAQDKTVIEGDVNGDGRADLQIILTGLHKLTAGDFIL